MEPPDTNILVASVPDAPALVGKLWEAGVKVTPLAPDRIRCVTRGVDREGIEALARSLPRGPPLGLSGLWPKVYYVCGKGPSFGRSSHSMVATKRRFNPNLQKVRIEVDGAPRREYVPPAA